jgi:survival of motor neuron-related-splicing factor 30
VDPSNVRPLEEETVDALRQAEKEAEVTKMALKRKIEQAATSDFQARSMPTKLRIDPNDPEDVVSDHSFLAPGYL